MHFDIQETGTLMETDGPNVKRRKTGCRRTSRKKKNNPFPKGKVNKQRTEKTEKKGKDKPIFIFLFYENNKELLMGTLELSRCRMRSS